MAFCIIFGFAWDVLAIHTKIWGWPAACCSLPRVKGLPLEEFFFMALMALNISTVTLIIRDIFLSHHWLKKGKKRPA
ncbi:MAG TPA: hypothetical protein VIH90_04995 [Candidatus Saccharimonadales bacterium]